MPHISLPKSEKDSYDYIYVDENNMVHLLCPITGGDTIGLDNTCQTTMEIKRFFGANAGDKGKSAADVLKRYKSDLKSDILFLKSLSVDSEELRKKKERLEQVSAYLKLLSTFSPEVTGLYGSAFSKGGYPETIEKLLEKKTNCLSILMSPGDMHDPLLYEFYVFGMNRLEGKGAALRNFLKSRFSSLGELSITSKRDAVLAEIKKVFGETKREISEDLVKTLVDNLQRIIKEKTGKDVDLTKSEKGALQINLSYFVDVLFVYDEGEEVDPAKLANEILDVCLLDDFWDGLSTSHFKEAAVLEKDSERVEKLSILTQFLLGEINAFCHTEGRSTKDFGRVLEGTSSAVREELVAVIMTALEADTDIEKGVIDFINENLSDFGLSGPISDAEAQQIIDRFNIDYRIVKDSPHMDEFVLFFPKAEGDFVNHMNRMSFHFLQFMVLQFQESLDDSGVEFVASHLESFSKRSANELPPKNEFGEMLVLDEDLEKRLPGLMKAKPELVAELLVRASAGGFVDFVKVLLKNGVNPNMLDKDGQLALVLASKYGHADVVMVLLENGADSRRRDKYGQRALELASKHGHIDVVKLILENRSDPSLTYVPVWNALKFAYDSGNFGSFPMGALSVLVSPYNFALIYASENGHTEIVELLLASGATPNMWGKNRKTPLMLASENGYTDVVGLLLASGASINARDESGMTALMYAAKNGHTEIVKALLENGADPSIYDSEWRKAFDYAIEYGNMKLIKVFLEKGVGLNMRSALISAAEKGADEVVKLILKNYTDRNRHDIEYALERASEKGHTEVVEVLCNASEVKVGLDLGRALSIAAEKRHAKIVELLFENYSDPKDSYIDEAYANAGGGFFVREDKVSRRLMKIWKGCRKTLSLEEYTDLRKIIKAGSSIYDLEGLSRDEMKLLVSDIAVVASVEHSENFDVDKLKDDAVAAGKISDFVFRNLFFKEGAGDKEKEEIRKDIFNILVTGWLAIKDWDNWEEEEPMLSVIFGATGELASEDHPLIRILAAEYLDYCKFNKAGYFFGGGIQFEQDISEEDLYKNLTEATNNYAAFDAAEIEAVQKLATEISDRVIRELGWLKDYAPNVILSHMFKVLGKYKEESGKDIAALLKEEMSPEKLEVFASRYKEALASVKPESISSLNRILEEIGVDEMAEIIFHGDAIAGEEGLEDVDLPKKRKRGEASTKTGFNPRFVDAAISRKKAREEAEDEETLAPMDMS